jgi:phenylalanyl-tRNA synthetase alpha chain
MAQDTFYVDPASLSPDLRLAPAPTHAGEEASGDLLPPGPEDVVLRTHTSPMQVRAMEAQGPPIFIVVPGRCYRSDPFDATHSPVFHQVEGLAIDESITFADLKGTLETFYRALLGEERVLRFSPSFFPFVEPGATSEVSCFVCGGSGCRTCAFTGWIEAMGSGMVHPKVLENCGIDPERYSGFAFGGGYDRLAMIRFGIPDIRMLWEGDVRFLEQFEGVG